MVSYGLKDASESPSDKTFVRIYLDAQFENFRSYVDVQHSEQLVYY